MTIVERGPMVSRQTMTRIPTPNGEYLLALYTGSPDNKEHMALVIGDVAGKDDVLIRIHSECFTGDVLGSLRCDCGEQLDRAMKEISARGRGVILYLRQEGRGIGLLEKLRAYNLQDLGHDTVDANLMLGHEADARDYTVAAQILEDLKVGSVQVMTNNPLKISELQELGVRVTRRIPIEITPGPDNMGYLKTKAERMSHMLDLNGSSARAGQQRQESSNGNAPANGNGNHSSGTGEEPLGFMPPVIKRFTRPAVTISYAQSIDGSIANPDGTPVKISGNQSMTMTHRLRASHDAILIGIGTALADDPQLTVRLVQGSNPQPVIIDSHLRSSPNARIFSVGQGQPWIVTTSDHDAEARHALEAAGAQIWEVPMDPDGRVSLESTLDLLGSRGISSLMVEGGSRIIQSFLNQRLVDQLVVTVSPRLIGGMRVLNEIAEESASFPRLSQVHYQRLGDDVVLWGRPQWEHS
jgi:GTP cyclohydrolase II